MLTEEKAVDKIEVVSEYKIIQVRTATIIKKDGEVVQPGQDLTGEDATVVAIANAVHTPEIVAAFEAKRAADLAAAGIDV
jgi:hypothetical protein